MAITGTKTSFLQASPGISPYSQRTIGAWIKMPATGTGTNYVFSLTGPSFSWQFNLHFAGNPTPNIFGSVAQSNNGTTIDGSGASGISNLAWHFILATFDNGGVIGTVQTVKVYYDGVLSTVTTAGGPVTALIDNDSTSNLYVWAGSTDGGAAVAYPMIWKRLLSQSEITALAGQGDPRIVAPANLVSFVQLNQASGTIPDLVGPGINWVVNSGPFTVVADPFQLPQPAQPTPPTPPSLITNNPPFMPVKFPPGPPTAEKNVWEDGPGAYVDASGNPIRYNGLNQTAQINIRIPKPV